MRAPLAAASCLAASIVWTVALIVDPSPFGNASATLLGIGLLTNSTVALAGMVVARGRWARMLGLSLSGATAVVAVIRSVDAIWAIGVVATAVSVVALFSPDLRRTVRKLPSASGPPPRVVVGPLLALGAPCLLGIVGADATSWALLVVGLSAPVAAFMYSRVIPGGLLAMRVVWPVIGLSLAPLLGMVCGVVSASLSVSTAVLAWHPLAKTSFHPPVESGTTFPIPPELAPKEVLDAAEIDETGRPR